MAIIVVPRDFPTIQAAVTAAQSGDLVYVKKGMYRESVNGIQKVGISIVAEKGAILNGTNQLPHGFSFDNSSFIEIKGFVIKNYTENGIRVIGFGSTGNKLINNKINNIGGDGFYLELFRRNNAFLWKNEVREVEGNGVAIQATDGRVTVLKNDISRVNQNGIFAFGITESQIVQNKIRKTEQDGIILLGINTTSNIFSQNNVKYNKGNGIVISENNSLFNIVEENKIKKNDLDGIQINADENFIIRNQVSRNKDDGIDLNSDNNEVVENVACNNDDDDIDNDGVNNQFYRNKVCDDSID